VLFCHNVSCRQGWIRTGTTGVFLSPATVARLRLLRKKYGTCIREFVSLVSLPLVSLLHPCVCVCGPRPTTASLASVRATSAPLLPPVFKAFLVSWASKTTKRRPRREEKDSNIAAHAHRVLHTYHADTPAHIARERSLAEWNAERVIDAFVDLSHLDGLMQLVGLLLATTWINTPSSPSRLEPHNPRWLLECLHRWPLPRSCSLRLCFSRVSRSCGR